MEKKLNFRGFAHMVPGRTFTPKETKEVYPNDSLVSAVFAPDPATGMPCAGAMLQIQNGTLDPATKEMLRQKFCQPIPGSLSGSENKDEVLQYTKTQNEKLDSYVQRLTADIENMAKSVNVAMEEN